MIHALFKLFHHDLCCLGFHTIEFTDSDVTRLQEYISPGSGITKVTITHSYNESVLGIVFSSSSLESLELHSASPINDTIGTETMYLLRDNSNLKELKISFKDNGVLFFIKRMVFALKRNTSVFHLLLDYSGLIDKPLLSSVVPMLKELLQSNHTLKELTLANSMLDALREDVEPLVQLVKIAANNKSLKKLSCSELLFQAVQSRIPKQYRYILYESDHKLDMNFYTYPPQK